MILCRINRCKACAWGRRTGAAPQRQFDQAGLHLLTSRGGPRTHQLSLRAGRSTSWASVRFPCLLRHHSQSAVACGALLLFDQRRPGSSDGTDEPRRTTLTHGSFCFSTEVWPVAMAEHLLPSLRRRGISGLLVWCVNSSCLLVFPLEGSLTSREND